MYTWKQKVFPSSKTALVHSFHLEKSLSPLLGIPYKYNSMKGFQFKFVIMGALFILTEPKKQLQLPIKTFFDSGDIPRAMSNKV